MSTTNRTASVPPEQQIQRNGSTPRTNEEKSPVSENTQTKTAEETRNCQLQDASDAPSGAEVEYNKTTHEPIHPAAPEPLTPQSIMDLRLPDTDLVGADTITVRSTVTVGKPPKDQFVRVHPEPEFRAPFGILELDRRNYVYLVAPGEVSEWMEQENIKSYSECILHLAITKHGQLFIWPVKQTNNSWHVSAREVAESAKNEWLKVVSDKDAKCYLAAIAKSQKKEPTWPEACFEEILEKAFKGRIIYSLDHEAIKELEGDD